MSYAPIDPPTPETPCLHCGGYVMASSVERLRRELADVAGTTPGTQRTGGLAQIIGVLESAAADLDMGNAEWGPTNETIELVLDHLTEGHALLTGLIGEGHAEAVQLPTGHDDAEFTVCANCAYDG